MTKHAYHVITGLDDGGAEAVLYRLCVSSNDIKNTVISLMGPGKYGPMLEASGVKVFCLGMPQGAITISGIFRLWRIFQINRPDIVQTWMYHANLVGGIVARLAGIKNVFWGIHHVTLAPEVTKKTTIFVAKLGALLSKYIPSRIVCCAQKSLEAHTEYGYSPKKMVVIPNGYDLQAFKIDEVARRKIRDELKIGADWLIGMVARFDPLKDHKNLIAALEIFKKTTESFKVVLVGQGMDKKNSTLVHWINQAGLSQKIHLLGRRSDIPDVMNALDIHVLSSISEAFPNVVAEAMACGTPAIVTAVGDAPLIVDDIGWVVPSGKPAELAKAFNAAYKIYGNTDAWISKKILSRNRVEAEFNIDIMVIKYHAVWNGSPA